MAGVTKVESRHHVGPQEQPRRQITQSRAHAGRHRASKGRTAAPGAAPTARNPGSVCRNPEGEGVAHGEASGTTSSLGSFAAVHWFSCAHRLALHPALCRVLTSRLDGRATAPTAGLAAPTTSKRSSTSVLPASRNSSGCVMMVLSSIPKSMVVNPLPGAAQRRREGGKPSAHGGRYFGIRPPPCQVCPGEASIRTGRPTS